MLRTPSVRLDDAFETLDDCGLPDNTAGWLSQDVAPKEQMPGGLSANPHRPGLKCGHQGGLNGVLNILDVLHSTRRDSVATSLPYSWPEEALTSVGVVKDVDLSDFNA